MSLILSSIRGRSHGLRCGGGRRSDNHDVLMGYGLTVSAAVRLIPRPPALVLRRKTKISVLQREGRPEQSEKANKAEADRAL